MILSASREASPVRAPYQNGQTTAATTSLTNGHNGVLNDALVAMNGNSNMNNGYHNGHTTEQSDDEYIDTIDDYDTNSINSDTVHQGHQHHASRTKVRYQSATSSDSVQNQPQRQSSGSSSGRIVAHAMPAPYVEVDLRFHNVLTQLNLTVERINVDVQQVMQRMQVVEKAMNDVAKVRKEIVFIKCQILNKVPVIVFWELFWHPLINFFNT